MLGGLASTLGQGLSEAARQMSDDTARAQNQTRNHHWNASFEAAEAADFLDGLGNAAGMFGGVDAPPRSASASAPTDWFAGFQHMFQNFAEEHLQGPSQPAASEAALSSLPVIKVSAKDLECSDSAECVICLEKFQVGDAATRITCGHLFHESCVKKWLCSSNQCPVCRFELPTEGRASTQCRRLRFRVSELSARSVRELKHLAGHLNIDVSGCIEKDELVTRLIQSGMVDIIAEEDHVPVVEAAKCNSETPPTAAQMRSMRASDIKVVMKRLGICTDGCLEKEDLLERFMASGYAPAENNTTCI